MATEAPDALAHTPDSDAWATWRGVQVLKAVNLGEYMELFVEHRVQGDVIFSLTEQNLKEMGVDKVAAARCAHHPPLPSPPQTLLTWRRLDCTR